MQSSNTETGYFSPLAAAVVHTTDDATTSPPANTDDDHGSLGACWSSNEASGFTTVIELLSIGSGMVLMASGFLFPIARNVERSHAITVGLILGGLVFAFGIGLVLMRTMASKRAIEVFDDRLESISRKGVQVLKWNEIDKLQTQAFTETRFSRTRLMVQIVPQQGKPVSFDTDWKGDVNLVLNELMTRCDYIVQNPENYRK